MSDELRSAFHTLDASGASEVSDTGRILLGTEADWTAYAYPVHLGRRFTEDKRPIDSVTFAELRYEQATRDAAAPIPNRTVTVFYCAAGFLDSGQVKRRDAAVRRQLVLDTQVIADRTFVVLTTGELIALDCIDKITIDPAPDDAAE